MFSTNSFFEDGDGVSGYMTGNITASSQIHYICDPTATTATIQHSFDPNHPHVFHFYVYSKYSCAVRGQYNCNNCTKTSHRWCLETGTCISKQKSCNSYIDIPQYCPNLSCEMFSNGCEDCLNHFAGCSWCVDSGTCMSTANPMCSYKSSDKQYCWNTPQIFFVL